jgi:thioredoxin-like negative regulator of GroEL
MLELDANELQRVWNERGMTLSLALFFYTPLCGTCKVGESMLEIIVEMAPSLPLYKCNINSMPQVAQEWRIESVPCLIIIQEGQMADKVYAMRSVPYLYERLKPLAVR